MATDPATDTATGPAHNRAKILDGKALATKMQAELAEQVAALRQTRPPGLAVLMVGDNPASAAYVGQKEKACDRVGIASFGQHFPATATQAEVSQAIAALNDNPQVDGILVQLPLPDHLDSVALLNQSTPIKTPMASTPPTLGAWCGANRASEAVRLPGSCAC
jgi:methylenetetrahydrofolate dehydrogenase (NADP+) / methenyltetrahydrofolate cyclohydrolase